MVFDGPDMQVFLRARDYVAVWPSILCLDLACHRLTHQVRRRSPALTRELRKVHQFNTFTIATCATGDCRVSREGAMQGRSASIFNKRDRLSALLENSGLRVLRSAGSYFRGGLQYRVRARRCQLPAP
jgi:hypothetical protein